MAIALVLLVVSAATAAVALVAVTRKRRAAEQRTAELTELAQRLDVLAGDLGQAVERAEADALRARAVGSLDRLVAVDEALARCAEAAAALPSVDLAVARVEIDGVARVASAGSDATAAPARARTGAAVPLELDGRRLGSLTVYGRGGAPPVPGDELDALQEISRLSAPVIGTARRPVELRPVTAELGDRRLFHETLALLAARAGRDGSRLTVCVLDVDDFRPVNARFGPAAGDRVIAEIESALRELVPTTGLACRTGGDEFAVALPGSGRIGAESLFARLQATLALSHTLPGTQIRLSTGIAELEPDDDGVSLFERATAALRRAKEAHKGTAA